jgi:hypothetical protein
MVELISARSNYHKDQWHFGTMWSKTQLKEKDVGCKPRCRFDGIKKIDLLKGCETLES